jgi:hypothetical protein
MNRSYVPHIVTRLALGVFFGIAATFSTFSWAGQDPFGIGGAKVINIGKLKAERDQGAQKRRFEIADLVRVVRHRLEAANDPEKQAHLWLAVCELGDLRAAEAAGPLLEMIDFRDSSFDICALHEPEDPDIIQALIDIGKPASTGAVGMLATDPSSKRAPMYVRVIAQVEGADVGKFMIRQAVDKEKDPEKKARLQTALGLFDKASEPVP